LGDGLWQLDIRQVSLNGCKKLDMASTVNLIVLHFKNIEVLDIGDTDISVLPEGLGECAALQTIRVPSHFKGDNFPHDLRLKLEAQGCEIL